jgi:Ni,Fe-hydrogenase III component G
MATRNRFENILRQMIGTNFSLTSQQDKKGVVSMWCRLESPSDISVVALLMEKIEGRLMTITAYNIDNGLKEIAYHFDLDGDCCTVTVQIDNNEVVSITPILKTADWTERELKELYDINVIGHPNPKRLFLEDSIAEGVMNEYIPLSEAMNGSSSQTLWEKVISATNEEENK